MEATYIREDDKILVTNINPSDAEEIGELRTVESSRLSHVGYSEDAMLLFVVFPNGGVYEYQGVEPDVYEGLLAEATRKDGSIGKYFNEFIKGPKGQPIYKYREVHEQTGGTVTEPEPKPAEKPKGEVMLQELPKEDNALVDFARGFLSRVRILFIKSPADYTAGDNYLVTLKAQRKMVEERLDRVYQPAYKTYKEALKLKQEALAPYDEAESYLKGEMLSYNRAELAQRQQAERVERERLQKIANEEAEQKAREQAEREARYVEAQGEPELAQSIRANPTPVAPVHVAPVVLESAVPKGKAVVKENWQFRITNEAEIPLTHDYYTLDERKLLAKAKLLKKNANIPGVEVYDAGTIASGRK
jgi:hypothetical protein